MSFRNRSKDTSPAKSRVKRTKLRDRIAEARKDESGAGGLISLLGVGILVTVIAMSAASISTFSVSVANNNLSSRQAIDAADSAIAEAMLKLKKNGCQSRLDTADYSYAIYRSSNKTAPTAIGASGLQAGCPTGSDKWVMIEAKGKGMNNQERTVIATYKWTPSGTVVIPEAINSGQATSLSGAKVSNDLGIIGPATIYTKRTTDWTSSETLNCQNSNIEANIHVESTSRFPLNSGCVINGNFGSKHDVDLSKGTILGTACSVGTVNNPSNAAGGSKSRFADCDYMGSSYGYKPNASTALKLSGTQCTNMTTLKNLLESQVNPVMVDSTGCSSNSIWGSTAAKVLQLKTDITFLMNSTTVTNLTIQPSGAFSPTFSIVDPSSVESSLTQKCRSAGSKMHIKNVTYTEGTSGMIYTACSLELTDSKIIGQLYGGDKVSLNSTELKYKPIDLPGTSTEPTRFKNTLNLVRVY